MTSTQLADFEDSAELHIFIADVERVRTPLIVCFLLVVVSITRLAFQSSRLGEHVPDTCVVICLGALVGAYLWWVFLLCTMVIIVCDGVPWRETERGTAPCLSIILLSYSQGNGDHEWF
jgi:hypothetical protein